MSVSRHGVRPRRILLVVTSEPDGPALAALPDVADNEVRVLAAPREVGTDDVVPSIEDALRLFDADEIWLVTSPENEASWLETGAHGHALARFDRPVMRLVTHGRSS